MRYYPISLNIQGKRCVVVGGGSVALRKVKMLLECGAKVSVISPTLDPDLAELFEEKSIDVIQRNYERGDLKGAAVVVSATDTKEINHKVAEEAKRAGALVNVADDPEPSDFIVPSFLRRGDLTIAVSTGGKSPAIARKVRMRLEEDFGQEYATLLSLTEDVRATLKKNGTHVDSEAWQEALDLDLLVQLVKAGQHEEVKTLLLDKFNSKIDI